MKFGNFLMFCLLFVAAWLATALGAWQMAAGYTSAHLLPQIAVKASLTPTAYIAVTGAVDILAATVVATAVLVAAVWSSAAARKLSRHTNPK